MTVELTNATKKLCVIGDPVAHSKSPLLHNAMCQALGLDYIYFCQPIPCGQVKRWCECAAFTGCAGFNATMPHKEALVPLMDELDPLAHVCGAVNTVRIQDGKFYGYNTDGMGFLRTLAELGVNPQGKQILLLGAGGAAKAILAALAACGAAKITVCNRTLERAEKLRKIAPDRVAAARWEPQELRKLAEETELLVNCTCLGMEGTNTHFDDLSFLHALPQEAAVCDAIYAPPETELLRRARELGHIGMNGMGMLIWQAVLALKCFTGVAFDEEKAKQAALTALLSETVPSPDMLPCKS